MKKAAVLIVEDEPEIAELIKLHVDREGYASRIAGSGRVALEEITRDAPDLVILDLMLPDLDGLEVCRRLRWREETREIPIVIVSAKGEEADIVAGIELGADDYVTKPFSPKVLMARIKNVLRRAQAPADAVESSRITLLGGQLIVDTDRHTVTAAGQNIALTATEFALLHFLAGRPGFVRTRDQIISAVHGGHAVLSSRTVDVHVTALRRKLGDLGPRIETVRGVGYRLSDRSPLADAASSP